MRFRLLFMLLVGGLPGCQPSATTDPAAAPPAGPQPKPFRLAGTWVRHTRGTFIVVEIDADSGGTYTNFIDYRKEDPAYWKPGDQRYSLSKSPMRVKCPRPGYVAIHTEHYRFDYNENGDTLIEIDKTGVQGELIRLKPQ